jgi:2-desacetyl-2-hydroxyethyl bacteriochlorophyllide A dehydrogenase
MQAAQLVHPLQWRMIDIPEPRAPGPGEALVRVDHVGICGTDLAGYLGKMPFFSYPRIPGHELGVEVLALGNNVSHVQVGDRCAVEPYLNCESCFACQRGHTNCCEQNQTLGVHCDGGLRPRFIITARKLHPANGLSMPQCALIETLAIGSHAVFRGGDLSGKNVVVVGAGPIGLSVLVFANLAGANVIVLDQLQSRLAFVNKHFAVAATVLASQADDSVSKVMKLTHQQGAEVVIDATGNAQAMVHAMHYCAFGGRLVFVGITHSELRFLHAPVMHRRELTLLASRNALPADFRQIIDHVRTGRISTEPWITHRAHFHDFTNHFHSWTEPASGVVKAIVEMPE